MTTKLKLKIGNIEFEYEGDSVYDVEAVKDLFSHIGLVASAAPQGAFENQSPHTEAENGDGGGDFPEGISNLSVQTVAARLGGKSAKDVTLAAAAHLQICQSKNSFTRKELLDGMKQANGYYDKMMSKNLSSTLQSLVSAKLFLTMTGDQISLSAEELKRLKAKIAQS